MKGIDIRKEEIKFSLFTDDLILCTENPKESPPELLELIQKIQKSCRIPNQHIEVSNTSAH
jgi:hypothetical protein